MSGGFWDVGSEPVTIWQTVEDASGARVSRKALFGGKAVSGQLKYVFDRDAEAAGLPPPLELTFEKQ
jgi:hypothetical protein